MSANLAIIAASIVGFILVVFILIPTISILRQRRASRQYGPPSTHAPVSPPPTPVVSTPSQPLPTEPVTSLKFPTLPEMYRLPVREGTPDQLVIMIEPNDEPSIQKRNVQRLIAYLKEEATRSNGAPAPAQLTPTPPTQ